MPPRATATTPSWAASCCSAYYTNCCCALAAIGYSQQSLVAVSSALALVCRRARPGRKSRYRSFTECLHCAIPCARSVAVAVNCFAIGRSYRSWTL